MKGKLIRLVLLGSLSLIYANAQTVDTATIEAVTNNLRIIMSGITGLLWLIYAMFSAWDWLSQSRANAVEFPTQRLLVGAALGIGVNAIAAGLGLV